MARTQIIDEEHQSKGKMPLHDFPRDFAAPLPI
jgi:hypothetical protein